jgi:hypothetical protein
MGAIIGAGNGFQGGVMEPLALYIHFHVTHSHTFSKRLLGRRRGGQQQQQQPYFHPLPHTLTEWHSVLNQHAHLECLHHPLTQPHCITEHWGEPFFHGQ